MQSALPQRHNQSEFTTNHLQASGDESISQADAPFKPFYIPHRFHGALVGTVVTILLTAVVSLGMNIRIVGLGADLPSAWLTGWIIASLIAVPTRFVLAPLVKKAMDPFTEPLAEAR